MATPTAENPVFVRGDKIVRRLDDFPELMQALRRGDLMTGRLICAQVFDLGGVEVPNYSKRKTPEVAFRTFGGVAGFAACAARSTSSVG